MQQYIANIALVVRDYDEAIDFYTNKLKFTLIEDTPLTPEKRWVVIAPPGAGENQARLLLAKAKNEQELTAVGNQTGGRVGFFLFTDDFWRDYERMTAEGIEFVRPPEEMPYGTVTVFKDLYGNLWDFIQPS